MHEMSLAESVREIVEDSARSHRAERVVTVVLEIGELAAVEVDALNFCLESVLKGTVAENAQIEIESLPGRGQCRDCGSAVPMETRFDPCPACGSYRVQTLGGTEMRVKALEMG